MEREAAPLAGLCRYVDVCIANGEAARDVFGMEAEAADITAGEVEKLAGGGSSGRVQR